MNHQPCISFLHQHLQELVPLQSCSSGTVSTVWTWLIVPSRSLFMLCLEHGIVHLSGEVQDSFTHVLTRLPSIELVCHRVLVNLHK